MRYLCGAFLALLVVGCGGDGLFPPDSLRIGQLGSIEIRLETPLRLGVGTLSQTFDWASNGVWSVRESISYRGLVGDEDLRRVPGDPAQFASGYVRLIAQLNEVQGLRLFIDELDPELVVECGPTFTRITLSIRDDARDKEFSWTRCATGSLADITPVGAGPDPAAARIVVAAQLARNAVFGDGFLSVYRGSVPFGTLARGEDSRANLPAPFAITDQGAWDAFWLEHAGSAGPPAVDFATEMVIVGAVGSREEAGESVEVRRILQVLEGTLTELYERRPGNFCSPAARKHTPFHIVVSPRTPDPLRFADVQVELVPCGG